MTTMDTPKCADCGILMKEGFLLDHGHGEKYASKWVQGPIQKGWLGIKTRGRASYPIVSYRCERCGMLKLYARNSPGA